MVKASWLVENADSGILQTLDRQSLEEKHPEAFADERMTEGSLREAAASSRKTWNSYPSLVLLSFCWQVCARVYASLLIYHLRKAKLVE